MAKPKVVTPGPNYTPGDTAVGGNMTPEEIRAYNQAAQAAAQYYTYGAVTASNPYAFNFNPPAQTTTTHTYPSPYALGSLSKSYQMAANAYGYNLTSGQAQALFNGNVSVSEFTNRLQALNRVNSNQAVFDQFENVLRINGLAKTFDLNDRLNFVLGTSSADFYKVWDEAATRAAAVNAGFGIVGPKGGGDLALTRANIQQIQSAAGIEGPTSGKLDQQLAKNLGALADLQTTIGPLARYAGVLGSNAAEVKQNLITYLFGGAGQEGIKTQVNQLLANQKAAETGPAEPTFRPSSKGLVSVGLEGLAGEPTA